MEPGRELVQAARSGNLTKIQELIDRGVSTDAGFHSETPLGAALNWNRIDAIKLLLQNGASPEVLDGKGFTPLMGAVALGRLEVVELLLAFGAQVNAREKKYGVTALMRAAQAGKKEIVMSLIHHGADPTIQDNAGLTAVQKAQRGGKREIADILSDHANHIDGSKASINTGVMKEAGVTIENKSVPAKAENKPQVIVGKEETKTEHQGESHQAGGSRNYSEEEGYNGDYQAALRQCTHTAKQEFEIIRQEFGKTESEINELLKSIKEENKKRAKSGGLAKDACKKLEELSEKLNNHFRSDLSQKRKLLKKKKEYLEKFTVTLFGRTMAGKSTIMEAITRGDGRTIGKGAQRTTRDIREYEWNHLRIIDTPGIGAYEGLEDREKAMSVVDETDLILFLTTTDGIQQETFESLRNLRFQNKPVIFVLNVKYNLEDGFRLKKFLKNPGRIFDERELEGHRKRIFKLAAEDLGMHEVKIVPIHAMAAFKATRKEHFEHSALLEQTSRINDLLAALQHEVTRNGRIRRLQTMLDGTIIPFLDFSNKLRHEADTLGDFEKLLRTKFQELDAWFHSFKADSEKRIIDGVKRIFGRLKGQVGTFLDANIESKDVNDRWKSKVADQKVEENIKQIQQDILNELQRKLEEFSGELEQEASFFTEMNMDGPEQCDPFNYKRFLGWTGAVAGAVGGLAGLAAWVTASNFWNPIGWVAGAVAIVATIISWLLRKRDRILQERKQEASKALIKQIDETESKVIRESVDWFRSTVVKEIFGRVSSQINGLCDGLATISRRLTRSAERIDSYSDSLNERLIKRTGQFRNVLGTGLIDRVVRYPGLSTKCLWLEGNGHNEFCREVCEALKERIDAVTYNSLPKMVVQALRPAQVHESDVAIIDSNVLVTLPTDQIAEAQGKNGINLDLAQRLLQIKITLKAE